MATRKRRTKRLSPSTVLSDCGTESCKPKRPAGKTSVREDVPGFNYTQDKGRTCDFGESKRCPVQMYFDKGDAYLRFCDTKVKTRTTKAGNEVRKITGSVAKTYKFSDPAQAAKVASKMCECWESSGKSYTKRSFKSCSTALNGLGRYGTPVGGRRRSRKK